MAPMTVVVMGVSGSGKTTVARELARRLGWPFAEGDDFHPAANVRKMAAGQALDDDDRGPWLRRLAAWIGAREQSGDSAVLTCSALKRAYRDLLRDGHPSVWFVHVTADPDLLRARLAGRSGHYMPPSLLDSQLEALAPLQADEPGVTVDAGRPGEEVAADELASAAVAALTADRRLPGGP